MSAASYNSTYNISPRIEIVFNNGAMTIGRFDAAKNVKKTDFAFDRTVKPISRIHARLEYSNNQYYLIDLGSANGTYLNGARIAPNVPHNLENGVHISFSDRGVEYIFNSLKFI